MKLLLTAIAMMFVPSLVEAEEISLLHPVQVAECSLEVGGKNLWSGKCCVDITAMDLGKGFEVNVHAMSWRWCLYRKNHSELGKDGLLLPSPQQKCCLGPWINIDQNEDNIITAMWSMEGYIHASGQSHGLITKTAEGTFEGENFHFSWKAD
jgi:hypothetical protein